jgi:hypothetical protein
LHAISAAFYAVKLLLVAVLAWRGQPRRCGYSAAFFLMLVTALLARALDLPPR